MVTEKEAIQLINQYQSEDVYIAKNIKYFLNEFNDPDDNSCELAEYYQECEYIVTTHKESREA